MKDDTWSHVNPIPGTTLVNTRNILELLSGGRYKAMVTGLKKNLIDLGLTESKWQFSLIVTPSGYPASRENISTRATINGIL